MKPTLKLTQLWNHRFCKLTHSLFFCWSKLNFLYPLSWASQPLVLLFQWFPPNSVRRFNPHTQVTSQFMFLITAFQDHRFLTPDFHSLVLIFALLLSLKAFCSFHQYSVRTSQYCPSQQGFNFLQYSFYFLLPPLGFQLCHCPWFLTISHFTSLPFHLSLLLLHFRMLILAAFCFCFRQNVF